MKKKLLLILLSFILCFGFLFAGCAKGGTQSAETTAAQTKTDSADAGDGKGGIGDGEDDTGNVNKSNGKYSYTVLGKDIQIEIDVWDYINKSDKTVDVLAIANHYGLSHSKFRDADNKIIFVAGLEKTNSSNGYASNVSIMRYAEFPNVVEYQVIQNVNPSDGYRSLINDTYVSIDQIVLFAYGIERELEYVGSDSPQNPYSNLLDEYIRNDNRDIITYEIP